MLTEGFIPLTLMNQENPPDIHVLIAAAGSGARLKKGADEPPKQYQCLAGKPVITHAIKAFLDIHLIKTIRCIINSDHADWYHDALGGLNLEPPITGGKERNISVYNALKSISNVKNEDIILIHDAARPLISKAEITALIDALKENRAATLACPVSGTLRKAENHDCGPIIERENLWELQTPQGFRYGDLLKAHESATPENAPTDDTSLVSALNIPVKIIPGYKTNIKITHLGDMDMAEKILQSEYTDIRTGSGFDVHAFDPDSKGPARLCGIDIPHTNKLKGHSDADVGLHTITDALLGAIGEGDIGQHFPPSDNTFKDMDSAIFLEKALEMLRAKGGAINNIDLTLICEEPKIAPYTATMKARITDITKTDPARINIKATTTEQLGFTGRKEGIAAQATVTVRLR